MDISDVIKELRFTQGWTQAELGKHLGMHGNLISDYERRARKASLKNASKIVKLANEVANLNIQYKDLTL